MFRADRGRKHLNYQKRAAIVAFTETSQTVAFISERLDIGASTVSLWQHRFRETGNIMRKRRSGRPTKLTPANLKGVYTNAWMTWTPESVVNDKHNAVDFQRHLGDVGGYDDPIGGLFEKFGLAIWTEVESGWAAVTAVRRQFVAIYSNRCCITSQMTSMSSCPVMKIKMSPVANEMSIQWILWTRFHHLKTLTLSWLQGDSNGLLNS
jgi:hypothetical protein